MKQPIVLSLSLLAVFAMLASACGTAEPTQTATKPPEGVSPLPSVEATFTSADLPAYPANFPGNHHADDY